jgi:hypothetical protein|nr:MAG TPA: hypothetical protein [Caudoviricetes sp.]
MSDALNIQIDGDHYKRLKMQPLELAYLIGGTPCFTKLAKYIIRDKGDRLINLDKAIHCINIERDICASAPHYLRSNYTLLASQEKKEQAEILINMYSEDPFVQAALKAMIHQDYFAAVAEVESLKRKLDGGE